MSFRASALKWRGNPFSKQKEYGLPHQVSGLVRNDRINLMTLPIGAVDFMIFGLENHKIPSHYDLPMKNFNPSA